MNGKIQLVPPKSKVLKLNCCLIHSVNTMQPSRMLVLLFVIGCYAASAANETSRFLCGNGFDHLVSRFTEEEIEVRQIPFLTDHQLNDLGVRTIGARLRLRSAAQDWTESQVGCLFVCLFLNFGSFYLVCLFICFQTLFCSSRSTEEQQLSLVMLILPRF